MLLRRVVEHFRKQEWTAIAIDFVIVVVGVFIGIQVANWNDARADQVRAHSYLERVRDDLDADIVSYADRLAFWSAVSDFGRTGLAYAEGGRSPGQSQWEVLLAYFQSSQVAEFSTIDTTYRELTGAGELDLIQSLPLRNDMSIYYAAFANPVLTERPPYREHVRGIIPLEVQDYIWANCYRSNARQEQELVACASPISEAQAGQIVAEISRNRALMGELRYWMSTMRVAAIIGNDRAASAAALRAAVDAELIRR